jgi:adsorption protein B
LTEDYEFGVRLGRYGLKQIFARQIVYREATRKSPWTGRIRQKKVREYIATREYFPTHFRQAVRQKSRWMLGINLQGWASLGWTRDWWTDYALARDRKALISQLAILVGYVVLAVILLIWALRHFYPGSYRYPPLIEQGTWLWYLVLIDTFFLLFRFVERAFWVQRIYGWVQALLSAPRLVWGNAINIAATMRALRQWLSARMTGELIQWDKTDHAYPSEEVLRSYRRRLGDLLLERRFITVSQLETALEMQRRDHRPLGAILLEQGWVAEDDLVRILGVQFHLSTRKINPGQVPPQVVHLVAPEIAESYGVFPLEVNADGRLVLATGSAISADRLAELEKRIGRPLEICLSSRSDLASAIESAYAVQT